MPKTKVVNFVILVQVTVAPIESFNFFHSIQYLNKIKLHGKLE